MKHLLLFILGAFIFGTFGLPTGSFLTVAHAKKSVSGLPVPRYASLRSDRVNLRKGPGKDYPIAWVFQRFNLPVEIIAEYEHWRKIRDSEGSEGWVFHRMLTGRRTALVTPWEKTPKPITVYSEASKKSSITAKYQSGVMVTIDHCNGTWCSIEAVKIKGWIPQKQLWGVYAGEKIK